MRRILDKEKARTVIDEYLTSTTPTLAGLCRKLGLKSYQTFLNYLNTDDEIGDILAEGYKHYVETHEQRLHDRSASGSIFALKCVRSLGFMFRESDHEYKEPPKDIDVRITLVPDKNESTTK